MDIQLPTMDGIQATKMIRDIEKQNKIGVLPENNNEQKQIEEESAFKSPVIIVALTASSLESDRQAALAAGCNDFLTKPVSLEWLEKKIMEWGCMQALIDVEGWRRWRQSTDSSSTSKDSLKAKKAPALLKKATTDENERAILEQRTKDLLKDESKAIVLVGVNKRRMSTFGPEEHKLTKKTSDPDLNSLSIPKQLAARKRLEAQQS
jgi:osomolarity two-component system response regulator SSK1